MARYIDGFLIPVPKKNLARYKKLATDASKVWLDHGALQYIESVGDDLDHEGIAFPFPKAARCKPGETVVFSFVMYKSRKHRDQVNKKIMTDPRMDVMMQKHLKNPPFDSKRMVYGGFEMIVDR